jgi:uncharacterized protein
MMSRGLAAAVNGKAISCEGGCDRAPQRRTVLRYGKTCDEAALYSRHPSRRGTGNKGMTMDSTTRTELEAAAFRRLVEHLRTRTDVQNIDLMNLAGFCRNCLSNWLKDAADAQGAPLTKDQSREAVYGMPYEEWKAKYQREAGADQLEAMKKVHPGH